MRQDMTFQFLTDIHSHLAAVVLLHMDTIDDVSIPNGRGSALT